MNYFEISLQIDAEFAEILMAELGELGFETFLETDEGLDAYIQEELLDEMAVKQLMERYAEMTPISYQLKLIPRQNWNEEWERSYQPITVADKIYVRATFHEPDPSYQYEIVITPKMAFGTGHHETTSMVLELQLDIDHQNKKVLDVGTGTGILAVMAAKLGATEQRAFDIDEWSVENTIENIGLNQVSGITVALGTIDDEPKDSYDIVLANINRNILLREIPIYKTFMKPEAYLLVSGFYEHDMADIQAMAESVGLKKVKHLNKNQWAAMVFEA